MESTLLDLYWRDLQEVPLLLSAEQERDLLLQYHTKRDRAAFERLVLANQRLICKLARPYSEASGVPLLDLIQEGNLGLIRAIEEFDVERGTRLSTYATHWIRQAISRAIYNTRQTFRLPVHLWEKLSRKTRVIATLSQQLGRAPTQEEIAAHMGVSVELLKVAELRNQDDLFLSQLTCDVTAQPGTSFERAIADEDAERSLSVLLRQMLPDEREYAVFSRFAFKGESCASIARDYTVSRERIRQICKAAARKVQQGVKRSADGGVEFERERDV
ncbi:RNA polymerase primary sigma factor/RNA polymerase nonessential primary-like sigma factor [Thermosporothrix hazakensis]|jgi:RNA polymerase sigma factor (sigma-70 family)|uniref:RNA polymerase primary sigma factor/RNA polymerase nonessential primary-like sigma factor n=1 Tax=Thermosporothrix hazakensis TaxID=644383 RepID=A0A326TXK2_THEHA|nr:RNA polymerase sigma factor RpoD/SigA [Thermosporothrix hazakensis]PZW21134.1 RNA polymerase primary sigma factor/RNA polymerase nonessential primary-like sigma factor [Thermosporothrix hazakensis]GCE50697.1 hypothetical protein KTH_55660 [Thermosporothrix hazakensis]